MNDLAPPRKLRFAAVPAARLSRVSRRHVRNACRWAMLGFASAILVEAATGDGVIPQALHYANALGLTGVSPSGV